MDLMAGAPLGLDAKGRLTLADCTCTARCGVVLNGKGKSRGSWVLGSRGKNIRICPDLINTSSSWFWDCEQNWRQASRSIFEDFSGQRFLNSRSWDVRCYGERDGKGTFRGERLGFRRKDGTLRSKSWVLSLRNSPRLSTREECFQSIVRGQAVGRSGRGIRNFRLHASRDPYETLGVPVTATDKEIKQAYRKLALKFHPDVNKEPDAQQKFMQIKNAYQTLTDTNNRMKYDANKRGSPSWDPFSWQSGRSSAQKPKQEEEFYGFGEFFKDVAVSVEDFFRDLQADSRRKASKPKSLWEELADIGEEFVEFLEKELNINDTNVNDKKSSGYEARNDKKKTDSRGAKKNFDGSAQTGPRDETADKSQVESEIAEIEDMLAELKKEIGM